MSRGTDDFTVQQVMNFIGEEIAAIDNALPEQHKNLGYAHMGYLDHHQPATVDWHVKRIQEADKKRDQLQQLSWDIERKCGELHSRAGTQEGSKRV